mgnify:FL=1
MSAESVDQNNDGDYVKHYSGSYNPLSQQVRDMSFSEPLPPGAKQRIENEVEADQDLTPEYIAHPEVLDYSMDDERIVLEEIKDGKTVEKYLEESEPSEAGEIGNMLGHLIADMHLFGSHGDPTLENFIYRDGDIISIDHEFYSGETREKDLRDDIRIIEEKTRSLETEKYLEFMENFREGYLSELEDVEDETALENEYPEFNSMEKAIIPAEGLSRILSQKDEWREILQKSGSLVKNSL